MQRIQHTKTKVKDALYIRVQKLLDCRNLVQRQLHISNGFRMNQQLRRYAKAHDQQSLIKASLAMTDSTRDVLSVSLPLTYTSSLRALSITLRTVTRVGAVGVDAQLPPPAHIRILCTLVNVMLTLTSGPAVLTDTAGDGVTGLHVTVTRAGAATLGAVAQTGTRAARALVTAHHVTHVARAGEAALRVEARLAAHTFLAFVTVYARAVVAGVQLVAAVAEALWDGVAHEVCDGGTAVVTARCVAQVCGGGVCFTST